MYRLDTQIGWWPPSQREIPLGLRATLTRAVLVAVCCCAPFRAWPQAADPGGKPFRDEPRAHALYTAVQDTMRRAASLSWTGDYRCADRGATPASATYKIWLRKPNSTRLEAGRAGSNQLSGILVGDGANLWIYWPQEKPRQPWESSGKYAEDYEKYRRKFYLKEPAPLGEYSLADHTGLLGVGMTTLTVDPSLFHGNPDSWLTSVDGARALGTEEVGGELCDQIEVSFLKGERTVFYWLAQKDHLPRKIKMVWPRYNTTVEESWSDVTLNAPAPPGRFAWSPPADWKEWRAPALEEGLLKPGTTAPDFELTAIDGSKIKLSALRGQVVWLLKWEYG